MELNNIFKSYDINRTCPPKRITVTHVNDVNTRIIELELTQGDEKLVFDSGCTAFASFVDRGTKQLIKDSTGCSINERGNVLIPIDNLHFHGKKDVNIEVSVKNQSQQQALALPFPLWVRVNPSILDDAEVTEDSLGTVPELLEEVRQALDVEGKEESVNKKTSISIQAREGDDETFYPTVGAVRNYIEAHTDTEILFDNNAYEKQSENITNSLLVFFGPAPGSNISLNLPPLTSADYGKVFHIEINFEKAVMSPVNGVRFQEIKSVDGQNVVSAYTSYPQYVPVVQGKTIRIDYTMSEDNVSAFRMVMYEQPGTQKINVKITKEIRVTDYAYPKAVIDSLDSVKQEKPTVDSPVDIVWTSKKTINSSGDIINTTKTNYEVTGAISVNAGDMYHIKTRMNYSNAFFVFKDANDETVYVKSANSNSAAVSEFDDIVTVPQNAVYLFVATYNTASSAKSTVASTDYIDDFDLNALIEPKFVDSECSRIEGWCLNSSGLPEENARGNILTANVTKGDTIKISGMPYLTGYYCSFFSESIEFDNSEENGGFTENCFISGLAGTPEADNDRFTDISVTVPENAKTVVISGYNCMPLISKMSGYRAKRKWVGKKWCAVGDSLTEKNNTAIKNYTDYIAEATGIEVINMGQSGTGYKQKESNNQAFYQRISDVPADSDAVTIFGSFNDAGYIYNDITIPWNPSSRRIINANGAIVSGGDNSSYIVSDAIPVIPGRYYRIKTRMRGPNAFFAFTDANNEPVYVEKLINADGSYPADYSGYLDYDGYIKAPKYAGYLYISSSVGGNLRYTYAAEDNVGTVDDTGTATLCGCINSAIDNLYAILPAANLGIISSVPWIQYNSYDSPNCIIYVEALEAICKKRNIPFLNLFCNSGLRPWDSAFRNLMYKRGNHDHPDENGHRLFSPRIEAFLDKLLLK